MRYLGLDLGEKSLGMSLSDPSFLIASSYRTLFFEDPFSEDVFIELSKVIEQENIEKIVLGFPKNMNNTLGSRAQDTTVFKEKLEQTFPLPVVLQDERLTTKEANFYLVESDMSRKKRKKKIDTLAATLILQTYLDKERKYKHE